MTKQKGRHWLRIGVYRSSIVRENGFMSLIPNMQACGLYPEKDEEMEEKILHSFFPADLVDLAFGLGLAVWLVIIKPFITLKVLVHYPTCIAMRCGKYCSIQSNPTNSANTGETNSNTPTKWGPTHTHFPFHPTTYVQSICFQWRPSAIRKMCHRANFPWQSILGIFPKSKTQLVEARPRTNANYLRKTDRYVVNGLPLMQKQVQMSG